MTLRVGTLLNGYCGVGRDSYGDKRVEAIGADWVIVRDDDGPDCYFGRPDDLLQYAEDET